MIHILVGTNRPGSRSREIANIAEGLYKDLKQEVKIVDLAELDMSQLDGSQYSENKPKPVEEAVNDLLSSEGIVVVCPEYNGSMPGVLKYFIDHWKYPDVFEARPFCFIGLGGRYGGLRPVEHLQQVFGHRNSYVYPERVFCFNVWSTLKDGKIQDKMTQELLEKQTQGFCRFIKALKSEKLHANDHLN